MSRNNPQVVVACGLGVGLLCGAAAVRLNVGSGVGPQPGDLAPDEIVRVVQSEPSRGAHVILFSMRCGWCRRQLDSLAELANAQLTVHILVLQDSSDTVDRAPAVPGGVEVSFVGRTILERSLGPIATPTHLFVDRSGCVTRTAVGFRSTKWIERAHAIETTRDCGAGADRLCGRQCSDEL